MLLAAAVAALFGAAELPADAPLYVAIRPAELAQDLAFLNQILRTRPEIAAQEDELRAELGFDPSRAAEWTRIGVDAQTPVVAALAAGGAQYRVVARVADPERVRLFVHNLARGRATRHLRATFHGDALVLDAGAPGRLGAPLERPAARLLGTAPISIYARFDQTPGCARQGPYRDFGAALRVGRGDWQLEATWGAKHAPLVAAIRRAVADDGLLDFERAKDVIAVAELLVPLRSLDEMLGRGNHCENQLGLDWLRRLRPDAPNLAAARNVVYVLAPTLVSAYSFERKRGVELASEIDCGGPASSRACLSSSGGGVAVESLAGDSVGVAYLSDRAASDWWQARPTGGAAAPAGAFFRARVDLGRYLAAAGTSSPELRSAIAQLGRARSTLVAEARVEPDLIRLDARVGSAP
jgi:hypothetical protein